MSHLLMIESWVGGTGRLLPEAIRAAGHRYTFVARRPEHYDGGGQGGSAARHPVLALADRVLQLETNDTPALARALRGWHARDPFDGALTICDYYLETVAVLAEALAIPHPFPKRVALERHKHHVRRALDAAGVPNPRYAVTSRWEATRAAALEIGFPLVLKPTDLASSALVRLVRGEDELAQAFERLRAFERNFRDQPRDPECLLEQYLEGPEFSVETCSVDGQASVLGVTDKGITGAPYFIEDSHMFPAPIGGRQRQDLETYALSVLRALRHDRGVAHIELKLTAAGPRLIEINPRLPGNYIVELVQRVTGVDLMQATLELALGRRPLLTGEGSARSAAIQFIVPPRGGVLRALRGTEQLAASRGVLRWQIDTALGATIPEPIDNACYLGHVLAIDPEGSAARAWAEKAARALEVVIEH